MDFAGPSRFFMIPLLIVFVVFVRLRYRGPGIRYLRQNRMARPDYAAMRNSYPRKTPRYLVHRAMLSRQNSIHAQLDSRRTSIRASTSQYPRNLGRPVE